MRSCLGLVEIDNLSPTFWATDRVAKRADVRILGIENSDSGALCLRIMGDQAAVGEAVAIAEEAARAMGTLVDSQVIGSPESATQALARTRPVFNPLLGIHDVLAPKKDLLVMSIPKAIGLLETQGLVAGIRAADVMLKSANVEVLGKEKIGAGFVTILIGGELAAVQSAIESGRAAVQSVGGKLILAETIANPHPDLAALLPLPVQSS